MELKRIIGPDVRTALRLVRQQLGPDAMILSNRRVAAGIEIIAVPEGHASGHDESPRTRRGDEAMSPPAAGDGPTVAQLQELKAELQSMRALLDASLAEIRRERQVARPGVEARLWRRLTRMGVPNPLVSELVAQLPAETAPEAAWELVLARLADRMGSVGDVVSRGGIWACVGPTGAGKTTMVCKLAVRHALEHGTEGMALVSMDCTRIGGADMLRTVARLLGVPLRVATPGDSLQGLLAQLQEPRLVLVDTAGLSRRSTLAAELLAELGALGGTVGSLLVLPATAQSGCLQAAVRDYGPGNPVAAVVTRLDEATSLGEVVGVLAQARLPLAYTSDGPDIPDDLQIGEAAGLVAHAALLEPEESTMLPEGGTDIAWPLDAGGAEPADAARIPRQVAT